MEKNLLTKDQLVINTDYLFEVLSLEGNIFFKGHGFYQGTNENGKVIFNNLHFFSEGIARPMNRPGLDTIFVNPESIKIYRTSENARLQRSAVENTMINMGVSSNLAKNLSKTGFGEKSKRKTKSKRKIKSKRK